MWYGCKPHVLSTCRPHPTARGSPCSAGSPALGRYAYQSTRINSVQSQSECCTGFRIEMKDIAVSSKGYCLRPAMFCSITKSNTRRGSTIGCKYAGRRRRSWSSSFLTNRGPMIGTIFPSIPVTFCRSFVPGPALCRFPIVVCDFVTLFAEHWGGWTNHRGLCLL